MARSGRARGVCVALVSLALLLIGAGSARAGTLPPGFSESTAFGGLNDPTVVRFAPDGTVFVAEKSGIIKTFDGLADPSPTVVVDLRTQVHNFWDRGLLGMELDFQYGAFPYVYVLYTHDAPVGGTAPRWGTPGATSDGCPSPPGATDEGCVVSGRLSRLVPLADGVREDVLIEDWCQQYPSHSVGSLEFDRWGALYASGGEGASFTFADWGQEGDPVNPCGDPPGGIGAPLEPPDSEGGALRSQDLRTTADPTSLHGSLIRVDPNGVALPENPLASRSDPNARRIIASGFRNPFRFDVAADDDIYVGDVGWDRFEEINRVPPGGYGNFGWPCYEGTTGQPGFETAGLDICEELYATPGATRPPLFTYPREGPAAPGEGCPHGGASLSAVRFYTGSSFPAAYRNALFFADYSRNCIWSMRTGPGGRPDPSTVSAFEVDAAGPVWLEVGPDGALYYADLSGGRIQRIQFTGSGNQSPTARLEATPRSGPVPLDVEFGAAGSWDPDNDDLDYAWDLDGDGALDDSTSPAPTRTYSQAGSYDVTLRVTDPGGATGTATTTIDAGNSPPSPVITSPTPTRNWAVGETIVFSGSAADPEQGTLPAAALEWDLVLQHCPDACHSHTVQSFEGVASGDFVAPDHEYPSHMLLRLTATDEADRSESTQVRLDPRTVQLTLESQPPGLVLSLNGQARRAPFTRTVIENSTNSLSAESPQLYEGRELDWEAWSNGGPRAHNTVANDDETLTAVFTGDDEGTPAGEPELTVRRERVPNRIGALLKRGVTAELECDRPCLARTRLVAKGSRAERLRVSGPIGRASIDLAPGTPGSVWTGVSERAAKRLSKASPRKKLRVRIEYDARGPERLTARPAPGR